MFENITKFFKKITKKQNSTSNSKDTAKERLHLVLMQDRANVSADFLDLMRQEIIDVIKKYIEVDESAIDVRLTNKENEDGTNGAPALYANIPIINIKEEAKKEEGKIAKERKENEKANKDEKIVAKENIEPSNEDPEAEAKEDTKKEENDESEIKIDNSEQTTSEDLIEEQKDTDKTA
ncbi:MAG: cell division topological specificity factor MinE [Clostridia bacterium]|nr:cell division topological specificity factor MinE [Clostridia bacterium]